MTINAKQMSFGQKSSQAPRRASFQKPLDRTSKPPSSALYQQFSGETLSTTAPKTSAPNHIGSVKWAFFIACLYTFFAAQLLSLPFILLETTAQPLEHRLWENLFNGIEMARYIVILGLAAKFLGQIASSMEIAPRNSAIVNGALLGSIMVVGDVMLSNPITPLPFCFCIGGAFGGYMFWRARGSVEVSSDQALQGNT